MSDKVNQKLKALLEQKYQTSLTEQEVVLAEQRLIGYLSLLINIKDQNKNGNC